jgi:hypothetical protein
MIIIEVDTVQIRCKGMLEQAKEFLKNYPPDKFVTVMTENKEIIEFVKISDIWEQ